MSHCKQATRLVIKCGTGALYPGVWGIGGLHLTTRFGHIARQVVAAETQGTLSALISSGAARAGQENFKGSLLTFPLGRREEWAGIGTRYLLKGWGDAFGEHGKEISYILASRARRMDDEEKEMIRSAIWDYERCGVVPILNENDMTLDAGYGRSENDALACEIARLIRADAILFLTGVGGVYEKDPVCNLDVRQYAEIDPRTALTDPWLRRGMAKKLSEAVRCFAMGMRVAIAGSEGDVIHRFAMGEPVGTMIGNSVRFY